MKTLKGIFIWLTGFSISLFSSYISMYEFEDTIHRIPNSEIPDTPTAYLMGGFFGACFGIAFTIIIFLILLLVYSEKEREIEFKNFLLHRSERKALKVMHIVGYILILKKAFDYTKALIDFHEFFPSELAYYISSIVSLCIYIIILASIFNKQE